MSILNNIKRGIAHRPQRVIIYGPAGVGKSTLAAGLPVPLFVDTEEGTAHLDVDRVSVKSLAEIEDLIDELVNRPHNYKTFVLDTIDWAEALIIEQIIRDADSPKITNIEDFGYGKGYKVAEKRAGEFLRLLNSLMSVGMHIVLLAHSRRVKFELPESVGSYDKYELKLSKNVGPLVKEWADALLFMNFVSSVKDGKGQGGSQRAIYTSPQAPWEAKNRHGLPEVISADPSELSLLVFKDAGIPREDDAQTERESLVTPLYETFGDDPMVFAFLEKKGQIPAGGTFAEVSEAYARRMLSKPAVFIATVRKEMAVND